MKVIDLNPCPTQKGVKPNGGLVHKLARYEQIIKEAYHLCEDAQTIITKKYLSKIEKPGPGSYFL